MEWKLNLKRKFTNYLQITCVSKRQKRKEEKNVGEKAEEFMEK